MCVVGRREAEPEDAELRGALLVHVGWTLRCLGRRHVRAGLQAGVRDQRRAFVVDAEEFDVELAVPLPLVLLSSFPVQGRSSLVCHAKGTGVALSVEWTCAARRLPVWRLGQAVRLFRKQKCTGRAGCIHFRRAVCAA